MSPLNKTIRSTIYLTAYLSNPTLLSSPSLTLSLGSISALSAATNLILFSTFFGQCLVS